MQAVAVTGASSGIGEALAHECARRGASVALLARRADRLEELAERLRQQYPDQVFTTRSLDVTERDTVAPALEAVRAELGDLDTVMANAGMTAVNRTGAGDPARDEQVTAVNLLGGMATVDAAAGIFRERGGGHILGVSSIAAFLGIPGSAAYSASKAGFTRYLHTVGMELSKHNIRVTTAHPGFIKTELAASMEKYPFVISADKGARIMIRALLRGRKDVTVPVWPWTLVRSLAPLVPDRLVMRAFR
jgi:short-subunit dehydrogenase